MNRQYAFALNAIRSGHTVLIYRGVTARSAKHVRSVERLEMRGSEMFCDGVSCAGMTMAIKPGRV